MTDERDLSARRSGASEPDQGSVDGLGADTDEHRSRWLRHPITLVASGLVVVATGVGAFVWALRDTHALIDSNVVAVLPFRVTGADTSLGYLREGMLDLLAVKLDGRPRTLDQRATLVAWRRAGGTDAHDLDTQRALALTVEMGAATMLRGEIAGSPSRLTISARLLEVPGGRERGRASVSGPATAVPALLDTLVFRLFAPDSSRAGLRASALLNAAPAALRDYLAGQHEYRDGQYAKAADAFSRAVTADSTLAIADVMLARSAGWIDDDRATSARAVAARHRDRLGFRELMLLGADSSAKPPTSCAEALAREERSLSIAPEMVELWYDYADRLQHCGTAIVGRFDALRRAGAGFQRALAIDSTFRPALAQLPPIYRALGDTVAFRAATVLLQRDSDSRVADFSRLLTARTPEARTLEVRRVVSRGVAAPLKAIVLLMELDADSGMIDPLLSGCRARATSDAERRAIAIAEYNLEMNRGHRAAALRAVARVPDYNLQGRLFEALFWDGDSALAEAALPATVKAVEAGPPADSAAAQAWWTTAFDLVEWELSHEKTTHAAAVIAALRPAGSLAPPPESERRRMAMVLEAQLALLSRSADARPKLEALDSVLALAPFSSRVRSVGNLVSARLWEQSGNYQRAYDAVARWAPVEDDDMLLYSTYIREHARHAAHLGRRGETVAYYRQYLSMRATADAGLRSHMDAIRAALKRVQTSGG